MTPYEKYEKAVTGLILWSLLWMYLNVKKSRKKAATYILLALLAINTPLCFCLIFG